MRSDPVGGKDHLERCGQDHCVAIADPAALVVTGRLRLAGGKLPIVAARPAGFYWNSESFAKMF